MPECDQVMLQGLLAEVSPDQPNIEITLYVSKEFRPDGHRYDFPCVLLCLSLSRWTSIHFNANTTCCTLWYNKMPYEEIELCKPIANINGAFEQVISEKHVKVMNLCRPQLRRCRNFIIIRHSITKYPQHHLTCHQCNLEVGLPPE